MNQKCTAPNALPFDGPGRPQIIIIGNGLERMDDKGATNQDSLQETGKSWDDLVDALKAPDHMDLQEDDLKSIPFPLKYHLLSTSKSSPYPLLAKDRQNEQKKLAMAARGLDTVTNPPLRRLPDIGADHIFTTNYTYSLEHAFYPKKNMLNSKTRSNIRFNYNKELSETGNQKLERAYRLHTGYNAVNQNGSPVNLWHIHGECTVADSIILGHDGYGRLLSRIVSVCGDWHKYHDLKSGKPYGFCSWPELFLFGDVYIIGLGLGISEFDLWWLLRRKQREEKASGRVYFYTNDDEKDYRDRDLMLTALGVIINPGSLRRGINHCDFYIHAMDNIEEFIAKNIEDRKHFFDNDVVKNH